MTVYYNCCECCDHLPDDGVAPDRHTLPCEGGCNDGEAGQ